MDRLPVFRTLIFACLAVAANACRPGNASTQIDARAWQEDLRFLARELPRRHVNAFHTVTRERFEAEVAKLDSAIPSLSTDAVVTGIMRIVALVGDGHTHLDLPPSWPRYPVELAWFGSDLRVAAAPEALSEALGARVTAIGGVPTDSAIAALSALVPRGENGGRTRFTATTLAAHPVVLHGMGLSPSAEEARLSVEIVDGRRRELTVHPATPSPSLGMRLAADPLPPWLRRLGVPWWTDTLPGATVYLAFRQYPPRPEFPDHAAALGRLLDESRARRLIIDLRQNGGGDFSLVRDHLLPVLRARPAITRPGGLYVITGPATFSAAMVNAIDLRNLGAVLVGEPTGARPNSYSEHGDFRLPNSQLRVSYSVRYYRFGADADTAVVPSQVIAPTWAEFRAGRDPVLEWILARPL